MASTTTAPSTSLAGTKKVVFVARQGSPRSATEPRSIRQEGMGKARTLSAAAAVQNNVENGKKDAAAAATGGNKGSAAAGEVEQLNAPSLETSEIARSQESSEDNEGSGGGKHETNRQHRSSSIPWVEEAAVGKHYEPIPSTKVVGEVETDKSTVCVPPGAARGPSSDSSAAGQKDIISSTNGSTKNSSQQRATGGPVGASSRGARVGVGDSGDPKRRTSSVSWAEDIVAGKEGDERQQGSPPEKLKSPLDTSMKASTVKKMAESSRGVSGGDAKDVVEDHRDPKRRTSSVSWAEDIAEGKGTDSQSQPSPPEKADSRAETSTDVAPRAISSGKSNGESSNNVNRRTSSISWAEDIVAGKEGESQRRPSSSLEGVKSAADASLVEASLTETTTKASPVTRTSSDDIRDIGGKVRDSKRRTSSVSWAEDIAEGKGNVAKP